MKPLNVAAISLVILTSTLGVHAKVPIIVATPQRMQAAMKMVADAQDLLEKGDVAGAKRNVDTVLQRDPTFWPALYVRAQIYSHEGKYDRGRIATRRSGKTGVLWRLRCCAPTSMLALGNTPKH